MNLLKSQRLICNINIKKSLVVIVLLSFLVACSCKNNLRTHEIKSISIQKAMIPKQTRSIIKNYTPRVVVIVVQTHATEGWCRLMLSAIMNKIEIVSIALGALYSHEKRPGWIMEYIENEMLKDEDIIISVDGSDTIVTERENVEESVQYFGDVSAATEQDFSSDDAIKGKQISPIIFLADPHCYAPQLDVLIDSMHKEHETRCHWFYKYAYDYAENHSLTKIMKNAEDGHNFLSGGAFISRVWAFKKAHEAYKSVLATSTKWWCDQSIWVLVFIWSVTQTNVISDLRALPTGFISLDYESQFFHYPAYTDRYTAAFMHFTGNPLAWRKRTPAIISRLNWYKNLSQSTKQDPFQKKISQTKLSFHVFNKNIQADTFSGVCGDDMLDNVSKTFLSEK